MDYSKPYVTIASHICDRHRYKVIIHRGMYYFAEFPSIEAFKLFAHTIGFDYTFDHMDSCDNHLFISYFTVNRNFVEGKPHKWAGWDFEYFWSKDELPSGCKPILGFSNGSLVTCYFTNDGETVTIFRPNPNATEVYHPLPLDEHITYMQTVGGF